MYRFIRLSISSSEDLQDYEIKKKGGKKRGFRLGKGIAYQSSHMPPHFPQDETGGTRYYRCGFYYILLASRHKWDMSIELLLTRAIPDDEMDYISTIARRW